MGKNRRPLRIPYDPNFKVRELLNHIYFKLDGTVEPHTFGHEWALFDSDTDRRLTEIESDQEPGTWYNDDSVFSEVGFMPGLRLTVKFV